MRKPKIEKFDLGAIRDDLMKFDLTETICSLLIQTPARAGRYFRRVTPQPTVLLRRQKAVRSLAVFRPIRRGSYQRHILRRVVCLQPHRQPKPSQMNTPPDSQRVARFGSREAAGVRRVGGEFNRLPSAMTNSNLQLKKENGKFVKTLQNLAF